MNLKNKGKCEFSVGQYCYSIQGRDKDKVFIVYEVVDEDYVLVVNGDDRTIDNPKAKNIKHLQIINERVDNFYKLIKDNSINDIMIKRFIKEKTTGGNLINVK